MSSENEFDAESHTTSDDDAEIEEYEYAYDNEWMYIESKHIHLKHPAKIVSVLSNIAHIINDNISSMLNDTMRVSACMLARLRRIFDRSETYHSFLYKLDRVHLRCFGNLRYACALLLMLESYKNDASTRVMREIFGLNYEQYSTDPFRRFVHATHNQQMKMIQVSQNEYITDADDNTEIKMIFE